MPDREKIIEALENADMTDGVIKMSTQFRDIVVELLKEQEPVEPELEGGGSSWWYVCGECHKAIDPKDKFCSECGRRILWGK